MIPVLAPGIARRHVLQKQAATVLVWPMTLSARTGGYGAGPYNKQVLR